MGPGDKHGNFRRRTRAIALHQPTTERGPSAVKAALVDAACELLAEVGPNAMSVRGVADRACVNHGQVHHYFGGKQGLIEAATAKLAKHHYNNARRRSGGEPVPPPLTLSKDSQYLRTVVRLVLDGDLATATQEIAAGVSVPAAAREHLTRNYPKGEIPVEAKARIALAVAAELGWAALEPFVMQLADVKKTEHKAVREHARTLLGDFLLREFN